MHAEQGGAFVSHLECSLTGTRCEAGVPHGLSEAGRPLLVRYDLDRMRRELDRDRIAGQAGSGGFWRWQALLPVTRAENRISLGEEATPLVLMDRSATAAGFQPGMVQVKDEGRLPTGSFKARGLALAVSMAREFGLTHLAMPSNGNAAAAMCAYARPAGIRTTVFCPDDTPEVNLREISVLGGRVVRVNGLIHDCGRVVGAGKEQVGWFDVSTLKEPYRIEGKKTMGLELAWQWGWRLPRWIFYPTGGGTGLIGMWKVFAELQALGWLEGELPRMVAVQAAGCAPLVQAWQDGVEHAPLWENAHTAAAGIRVPVAVGDFLVLRAVRESGGFAVAVEDRQIFEARDRVAETDGVLLCPEGAATWAACAQARAEGRIAPDDSVVLFNCATGLKYPMPLAQETLDCHSPVDYGQFVDPAWVPDVEKTDGR